MDGKRRHDRKRPDRKRPVRKGRDRLYGGIGRHDPAQGFAATYDTNLHARDLPRHDPRVEASPRGFARDE